MAGAKVTRKYVRKRCQNHSEEGHVERELERRRGTWVTWVLGVLEFEKRSQCPSGLTPGPKQCPGQGPQWPSVVSPQWMPGGAHGNRGHGVKQRLPPAPWRPLCGWPLCPSGPVDTGGVGQQP